MDLSLHGAFLSPSCDVVVRCMMQQKHLPRKYKRYVTTVACEDLRFLTYEKIND